MLLTLDLVTSFGHSGVGQRRLPNCSRTRRSGFIQLDPEAHPGGERPSQGYPLKRDGLRRGGRAGVPRYRGKTRSCSACWRTRCPCTARAAGGSRRSRAGRLKRRWSLKSILYGKWARIIVRGGSGHWCVVDPAARPRVAGFGGCGPGLDAHGKPRGGGAGDRPDGRSLRTRLAARRAP